MKTNEESVLNNALISQLHQMLGQEGQIPSNEASSGVSISTTAGANPHLEDSQLSDEPEEQQEFVQPGSNDLRPKRKKLSSKVWNFFKQAVELQSYNILAIIAVGK